ncbi:MAG: helix-turn-helix domain-containing protein [Oscillospiraceae bacterium]|jgi:transcriptional regulator with XRE-family HTH domain|nr:helix-turn-helix domain-containing protein [Oscillospiraceae bacterium]
MNISISENLKKLRISREITQDALAERLGVSAQSVSKWERGDNYPDITMLPAIANFFDITVDELLGMDVIRNEKRVADLKSRTYELLSTGMQDELIERWRELASDMPNNYEVQLWYANQLVNTMIYYDPANDTSVYDAPKRAAVPIFERILENCTDDYIRMQTISPLLSVYADLGELDKARALADRLPNAMQSREQAATEIAMRAINDHIEKLGFGAKKWLEIGINNTEEIARLNSARAAALKSTDPAVAAELIKPFIDAVKTFAMLAYNALMSYRTFLRQFGREREGEYIELIKHEFSLIDLMNTGMPRQYGDNRYEGVYQQLAREYTDIDFDTALEYAVKTVECAASVPPDTIAYVGEGRVNDDGSITPIQYEATAHEMSLRSFEQDEMFDPFRNEPRFIAAMNLLRTDKD